MTHHILHGRRVRQPRTYLDFIGWQHPADTASGSLFRAPAWVSLIRDRLYVMDRFLGLVTLELSGLPPPEVDEEVSQRAKAV